MSEAQTISTKAKKSKALQLKLDISDEPRVDSRVLAQGLNVEHRSIMRLILRYQGRMETKGILRFQIAKISTLQGRGRPEKYALLNEEQSYFLLTLSRNTDKVVELKDRLTREFMKLRRQAEKRAKAEWMQMRLEGKDARRHETDTIKAFVEYAEAQGSQNAQRYYGNITKMTYKALGLVNLGTGGSLRDILDGMQLTLLATAEHVAAGALRDGIASEMQYKDIYQLAKSKVEVYANTVAGIAIPQARGDLLALR